MRELHFFPGSYWGGGGEGLRGGGDEAMREGEGGGKVGKWRRYKVLGVRIG